jgi:hypothetical protein
MSDDQSLLSRRNALNCVAYGGAGTPPQICRMERVIYFEVARGI